MKRLINYFLKRKLVLGIMILTSSVIAQTGAKYLVIAHDNFVDAVKPLVQWKTQKGVQAKCVPLSVTGSSPSQIKTYIQNAYNTWITRPEYILLVGSPDLLPSNNSTDDYYADMTGNYHIELCVGRFHCATTAQCDLMVAKTINYEKSETMHDSTWFTKGTTIVGEDQPPDPYYQSDCRYIRNLWLGSGYTQVDSFISTQGHNATDVINAINNGRTFVVYRGQSVSYWWGPFNVDPNQTNNSNKLPIVVSGTCATMTLDPGENMLGDAFLRAGTVQNPKGAIGFFGTTYIGSHVSNYRGAVTRGFFQALYVDSIFTMGGATRRGKFLMDSLYPNQTRYMEWNLLGDPELNVWTSKPHSLTVNHDSLVFLNPTDFQISVTTSGNPVQRALVCVMMDSTIYSTGYTDSNGQLTLSFTPQHIGILQVTVTSHNFFPYEGTVEVTPGNMPYLRYHHYTIDDSPPAGNGDSLVNPGETINLGLFLINSGTQTANGVTARLSTTDQFVTVLESIANFGDIAPGAINGSTNPYQFSVTSSCYNGHAIDFQLHIFDDSSHAWESPFSIIVNAGQIEYNSYRLTDSAPCGNGNGQLGPNENVRLRLTLNNSGLEPLTDVWAKLRVDSPYLQITDSLGYIGTIQASSTANNNQDPFALSTAPNLPRNYPLLFTVVIHGNGTTYTYLAQLTFTLNTDPGQTSDPTGPDAYGYYCYDNTDTNSGQAPNYDWYEISPPGPGTIIDQISNSDSNLDTLNLPFLFQYYEQNFNQITVATNGFLTMGPSGYRWGYNSAIPDTYGPAALIAPFWDDLNTNEANNGYGAIYQYSDTANHRFIIQYQEVAHYNQPSIRETFQTILLDPVYYPTPTGDGEIIYQYHTVTNPAENTVGIESPSETQGIQYLYNNSYAQTAARLTTSRALCFTTQSPIANSIWLTLTNLLINDSIGGNNNHIPEPGENIQLTITLTNHGQASAENVIAQLRSLDANVIITDSTADFGTIPAQGQASNETNPYSFQVSITPTDTILEFSLTINATGYNATQYFAIGLNGNPGVLETHLKPALFSKLECFPNPFQNKTLIRWQLPQTAQVVELQIFDVTGRLVTSLQTPTTNHNLFWYGQDNSGIKLRSGIYFATLFFKVPEAHLGTTSSRLVKKITISR